MSDDELDDFPELTEADLAIAWCRILAMAGIDHVAGGGFEPPQAEPTALQADLVDLLSNLPCATDLRPSPARVTDRS
jgi:hypothetical protein